MLMHTSRPALFSSGQTRIPSDDLNVKPCPAAPLQRCQQQWTPAQAETRTAAQTQQAAASSTAVNPWPFGFQVSERTLVWGDEAQRRLLLIHASKSLDKDIDWIEERLDQLSELLPDLMARLERMKAEMVLTLIANCETIADKAVQLKSLLPQSNVSKLIAQYPALILDLEVSQIKQQLDAMRATFGLGRDVEGIIAREPAVLTVDIAAVVAELRRLMPQQNDPVDFLAKNPRLVLDMQSVGMPSTIDGDLTHLDT